MRSQLFLPVAILVLLALTGCTGDVEPDKETDSDTGTGTDPDSVAMVLIPAGTFMMGSPTEEEGRASDEDQHEVTLTRAFWMGVYEVTQGEFESLMGYQPSSFPGCATCPVETISWYESAAFANAVSDLAGLELCYDCAGKDDSMACEAVVSPYDCAGYRLPTEAEWEYSARAGSTSAFSNGGNLVPGTGWDCNAHLELDNGAYIEEIAWTCGDSGMEPHLVGELAPNTWGLYDVHGNVWEWVHDGYESDLQAATDPYLNRASARVRRGGSWGGVPAWARAADRTEGAHGETGSLLGLRLARSN